MPKQRLKVICKIVFSRKCIYIYILKYRIISLYKGASTYMIYVSLTHYYCNVHYIVNDYSISNIRIPKDKIIYF